MTRHGALSGPPRSCCLECSDTRNCTSVCLSSGSPQKYTSICRCLVTERSNIMVWWSVFLNLPGTMDPLHKLLSQTFWLNRTVYIINIYVLVHVTCSNSRLLLKLWNSSTFPRTPWKEDQPDARPVPPQNSTIQKDEDNTSIPQAEFETTTPVSKRPRPTYHTARPLWSANRI
jgi:hypothetical protein